jgi:tetratricopeptide (TPR) repeat protein
MTKQSINLRRLFYFMTVIMLLAVAACGSAPPQRPAAVEKAKKADLEAHRALRDGDLNRASELFNLSMQYHLSLDNRATSAMAAINLAAVSHKLGDDSTALELLEKVLADKSAQVPTDMRAAAAFRKAVILTDTGNAGEAESALQLAAQECNKQCSIVPGINNLRARLALAKGDFTSALSSASTVIGSGADKDELANARRMAAVCESALGNQEVALVHYQAALELDKELALSARIAKDLQGIAGVLLKLGRKDEADVYTRRAESVINAAKNLPGKVSIKPTP